MSLLSDIADFPERVANSSELPSVQFFEPIKSVGYEDFRNIPVNLTKFKPRSGYRALSEQMHRLAAGVPTG